MASGCVPLFLDLGSLPAQTLALYPREELAAALRLPGLTISPSAISPSIATPAGGGGERGVEWYLHPAAFALDAAALRPSLSSSLSPSLSPSTSASTSASPSARAVYAQAHQVEASAAAYCLRGRYGNVIEQ